MPERYCPKCRTDVEDVGGFCLLGHSLKLSPVTESLSLADLRSEVDKAFSEALEKVYAVTGEIPAIQEAVAQTPPESSATPAPPPPPGPEERSSVEGVWASLENMDDSSDPITIFAPDGRMDWGPQRGRRRR